MPSSEELRAQLAMVELEEELAAAKADGPADIRPEVTGAGGPPRLSDAS